MTKRAELLKIHGRGKCHICGKLKIEEGSSICSYPHARVPVRAVDPQHPGGFVIWSIDGETQTKDRK